MVQNTYLLVVQKDSLVHIWCSEGEGRGHGGQTSNTVGKGATVQDGALEFGLGEHTLLVAGVSSDFDPTADDAHQLLVAQLVLQLLDGVFSLSIDINVGGHGLLLTN